MHTVTSCVDFNGNTFYKQKFIVINVRQVKHMQKLWIQILSGPKCKYFKFKLCILTGIAYTILNIF